VGFRRAAATAACLYMAGGLRGGRPRGGRGAGDALGRRAGQAGGSAGRAGASWFDAGRLAQAAEAARAADADARRLGFEQHPFAVDYLRVLAGAALEQRDLDTAEHLTERALSISERFRPVFEFLALLDRAGIWAARGHIPDALATVD